MCDGHFTSTEKGQITIGADAWDAGAGEDMRGADWAFIRGSDHDEGTCFPDDGQDEVYSRSATWFQNNGQGSAIATCLCDNNDGLNDRDIVFRDNVSWDTGRPDTATGISVGQTSLHEFGHLTGFLHEDDVLATMNSTYPLGGDLGSTIRPHEDDYVGLTVKRSDSSTGKNFTVGKFRRTGSGTSTEFWLNPGTYCPTTVEVPNGPTKVRAVVHGTALTYFVNLDWYLNSSGICGTGTEYAVGARTGVAMASNTPAVLHPAPYDFTNVPAGNYYLCVTIDPEDGFSETDETDNTVRSDNQLTVLGSCP